MPVEPLRFCFHGVRVAVEAGDPEVREFVRSDFSLFRETAAGPGRPDVVVRLELADPPLERIPDGTVATLHTKTAVVYTDGALRYHDSGGRALVIQDGERDTAEVFSLDRDQLVESAYLMISSRVGELLDRRHLHRIHAMGVAIRGRAVVCILPMGGGKTTLALSLLERDSFKLLSEEIPLVSRRGRLHAFPIRIGIASERPAGVPERFVKTFHRTRHGPKTLIDAEYYRDRIAETAEPGLLFVGRRAHSRVPRSRPLSKVAALRALVQACVLGVGVPQLMEYVLRFDLADAARQTPILASRLRASLALVRKSETHELLLGRDLEANADFVTAFARERVRDVAGSGS